jgi:hypothetical protein
MSALRPEEQWVCEVISQTLGVAVVQHDDGSRESMHDLSILYPDQEPGAVEVTAAADGQVMALWKILNRPGERWIEPDLDGGWIIEVVPGSSGKRVRRELPSLLRELEAAGIRHLKVSSWWPPRTGSEAKTSDLGITSMRQGGTDYPGSIYSLIDEPADRRGGWMAPTGDSLAAWAGDFLAADARRDVCSKLERSGASERHAVLILPGFALARFDVTNLLMDDGAPLPSVDPDLPAAITHVWLMSTWSTGMGMRWSPTAGWTYFDKLLTPARAL